MWSYCPWCLSFIVGLAERTRDELPHLAMISSAELSRLSFMSSTHAAQPYNDLADLMPLHVILAISRFLLAQFFVRAEFRMYFLQHGGSTFSRNASLAFTLNAKISRLIRESSDFNFILVGIVNEGVYES